MYRIRTRSECTEENECVLMNKTRIELKNDRVKKRTRRRNEWTSSLHLRIFILAIGKMFVCVWMCAYALAE